MSAAIVKTNGVVKQLGTRAGAVKQMTADDVQDSEKLAREVNELRGIAAEQKRRHNPRWFDFEDVQCGGSTEAPVRLRHGFGSRVSWWVVEWDSNGGLWFLDVDHSFVGPALTKDATSDANTLVLKSYFRGIATIRVEEVG